MTYKRYRIVSEWDVKAQEFKFYVQHRDGDEWRNVFTTESITDAECRARYLQRSSRATPQVIREYE